MKIGMIAFTRQGGRTLLRLSEGFKALGYETAAFLKREYMEESSFGDILPLEESAARWTAGKFRQGDGIIYVGAVGIAVRLIAPHIAAKDRDPAVVVADERGQFTVALLSGHLGGANGLAQTAAEILGAIPVITTATDINERFAVDLFAKENNLSIRLLEQVRNISSVLLDGGEIGFFSEFPVCGAWPKGLVRDGEREWNISVTIHSLKTDDQANTLRLIPASVVAGIGCRKGASAAAIEAAVRFALNEHGIDEAAVCLIASIDIKKEEPGITEFCRCRDLNFVTFSPGELSAVAGSASSSDFVLEVTGVPNVCERAALCALEGTGRLIAEKMIFSGVTVALAAADKTLYF